MTLITMLIAGSYNVPDDVKGEIFSDLEKLEVSQVKKILEEKLSGIKNLILYVVPTSKFLSTNDISQSWSSMLLVGVINHCQEKRIALEINSYSIIDKKYYKQYIRGNR